MERKKHPYYVSDRWILISYSQKILTPQNFLTEQSRKKKDISTGLAMKKILFILKTIFPCRSTEKNKNLFEQLQKKNEKTQMTQKLQHQRSRMQLQRDVPQLCLLCQRQRHDEVMTFTLDSQTLGLIETHINK